MPAGLIRIAVITLSDKGSAGAREDESGRVVADLASTIGAVEHREILPDEKDLIRAKLVELSDRGFQLILTTGGTGLSPRDVTPEATMEVADRLIPGMAEAMRQASLLKTPNAMLSRAVAAVRGNSLIVNLPGSPKGAKENLEAVLPVLDHAIRKICGDPSDCAA